MFGGRLLLLALVVIVSLATSDLPYCSRSFSPEEWQREGSSYLLNIKELEQHLQPQPYFISKLTLLATGKPQSFFELVTTAVSKVVPLNRLYLSICALVFFLMIAVYISRKKHEFNQISLLNQVLSEKVQTIKYLKIGIVFVLAVTAVLCVKGISEVNRQEKALNHIICRMVSTKNFIQKNSTSVGSDQLEEYTNSLAAKINGDTYVEMSTLQKQVRMAQYPQKNVKVIIEALKAEQYKGPLLQQLHSANKTLSYVAGFMASNFGFFQRDCRQKAVFFLFEVIKITTFGQNLLDAIRKGRIKDLRLEDLPSNTILLGKICVGAILVIVIAAGMLLMREQEQDKWLAHLGRLRFVLSVLILLCFVTVIVTTLFLSFNLWIYQGEKELIRDPGYCYNAFSVFNNKIYGGVCRLLSPTSNETRYRSLSPYYSNDCHSVYDEYNQMTKSYLSKNQTYFYDLMASSAQQIRNDTIKREILKKIESRYSKLPLIPIMKDTKKHLALSITLEDEIQSQNISIKEFIEDLTRILTIHMTNSTNSIRQICKALSITFSLILLLGNLAKWLAGSSAGLRLKEKEEFQQSSLNEIESL